MRVLFVEDHPMNRRVMRDMLTVAGVDMAEAEDAETGLCMIDQETFDLVLMDLRMPGMDGFEAIRHIRARRDAKAQVPVVVVTAETGDGLRRRCLAAGADGVITKPVAMNLLFETLGRIARGTPARRRRGPARRQAASFGMESLTSATSSLGL